MSDYERLWDRRYQAIYTTRLSYLYHKKRERFFDLCDKMTKCATVLLGAFLLKEQLLGEFLQYVGAAVSALGLMSLVFSYGDKKQKHKELAEEFGTILSKIELKGEHDFNEQDVNFWQSEIQKLNVKEPPALGTLVVLCQNELAIVEKQPEKLVKIQFHKQLLANWCDFKVAT